MKNKRGFTLIELLVVVLIIGILAVVALPQYNKTVERIRLTEAKELLQSVYQAQQRYYLTNNEYAGDFTALDIEVPNISARNGRESVSAAENFEISLEEIGDNNLVASRMKNGNKIYSVYKDLTTGQLCCKDLNETDKITCDSLEITACPESEEEPEEPACVPELVNCGWKMIDGQLARYCINSCTGEEVRQAP